MTTTATTHIDQTLRIIADIRRLKPRDPVRAIEDRLLELRHALTDHD